MAAMQNLSVKMYTALSWCMRFASGFGPLSYSSLASHLGLAGLAATHYCCFFSTCRLTGLIQNVYFCFL